MGDTGPLFERVLQGCGIATPSRRQPGHALARYYAEQIASGAVTPYEGALRIWWDVTHKLPRASMKSSVPIVRQVAWLSVIPQAAVAAALIASVHFVVRPTDPVHSFVVGGLIYLALSRLLRSTIAADHRRGVSLIRAGRFAEGIQFFERSYAFFTQHLLLDRWRFLTLLSSSAMSYREMGLCNIGLAYSQLGDGSKSKDYYRRALSEFPDSAIAVTSLRMFDAAESSSQSTQAN